MRVNSVVLNLNMATSGRMPAEKIAFTPQTMSRQRNYDAGYATVAAAVPLNLAYNAGKVSSVRLTFTGADKNIEQFLSYAPENKRYGLNSYNFGGLGVVAQEAPNSWRLKETADVRDFSPYHSYDNAEGGVKVAELMYKDGVPLTSLPQERFYKAAQNESLEEVAKRLNKDVKNLAFVVQQQPEADGKSKIIILKDEGISGSFKTVSDESVTELKEVKYRIFGAQNLDDPVVVEETKASIRKDIENGYIDKIKKEINSEFNYEEALQGQPNPETTKLREEYSQKIQLNLEKYKKEIDKEYKKAISGNEYTKRLIQKRAEAAQAFPERNFAYFVHTEDLAKFANAYGISSGGSNAGTYGTYGAYSTKTAAKSAGTHGGAHGTYGTYGTYGTLGTSGDAHYVSTNTFYGDNTRALVDALPKFNTKEHGFYNPANFWLHDRPAFTLMANIANKAAANDEYYNGGVKAHGTFHNPGRDYQGWMNNPFEFFRIVADENAVLELQKHPQIEQIKYIEKNWYKYAPKIGEPISNEAKLIKEVFDPYFKNFIDDFGTYNISMIPVAGAKANPKNFSAGTVSVNYGKEMKNADTPDIALGMTQKLNEITTHDVTNGNTPANLRIEDPEAGFNKSGEMNELTKAKSGFTTYKYEYKLDEAGNIISDNIDEVLKAKEKNTKWLLDLMADAYKSDKENGLNRLFFSDSQINSGAKVIGHLSEFKKGDKLFMGWGRPDPQKGFPSTFGALKEYLNFLKDKSVPDEIKLHTKFLAGAGVWPENARDYNWVKYIIEKEIGGIENGKYAGNAAYVNGFFPNRLVGCASWTIFTSRYEPCGITPLESFASATPCISIKTGGAPDFINETRGLLTKNPYLLKQEKLEEILHKKLNLTGDAAHDAEVLDGARQQIASFELKDCVLTAMRSDNEELNEILRNQLSEELKLQDVNTYKSFVQNAGVTSGKIDWDKNAEFNGGKTANERYMNEIFERNKGMEARNKNPMSRLVSEFGTAKDEIVNQVKQSIEAGKKTKIGKTIAICTLAVLSAAGAVYYICKRRKKLKVANSK